MLGGESPLADVIVSGIGAPTGNAAAGEVSVATMAMWRDPERHPIPPRLPLVRATFDENGGT